MVSAPCGSIVILCVAAVPFLSLISKTREATGVGKVTLIAAAVESTKIS